MDKVLQKELAIKCLEKLNIHKPYIRIFESHGLPCYYERYAGFWADQEPELWDKIKEVESEYKVLVYAITHELVNDDEMWSMLCVPEDCENIDDLIGAFSTRDFYAFSYTWNKSVAHFSEFGDVVVRSAYGGIKRIF